MKVRGILLAGGASSRFGSQKLLHALPDGTTIGARSAATLRAGIGNALAVVRPGDVALMRIFAEAGCGVLETPRAVEGMGGSLAAAVSACADAEGWIVALADMPYIQPASILAVRRALEAGASIAVPCVEGQRGHPVGFSAAWRESLSELTGDEGARRILAANGDAVTQVPVEDAGIFRDVDVPGDLAEGTSSTD
ncbi:MAG: nucleotidyltransferase family protein [Burkholderiales bacterium]|nr:nucleotidyltransferase family protein [Burkholderiales bacterium]